MCPPRGQRHFAAISLRLLLFVVPKCACAHTRPTFCDNSRHLAADVFAKFSPNYSMAARTAVFILRSICEYRLNACEFSECPDIDATRRLSPVAEYAICIKVLRAVWLVATEQMGTGRVSNVRGLSTITGRCMQQRSNTF